MARTGRTAHPLIAAIQLARLVNLQSGGAVIAPWQIDELDDVTLDVFRGLAYELPTYQRSAQETESRFEQFRKQHGYRM